MKKHVFTMLFVALLVGTASNTYAQLYTYTNNIHGFYSTINPNIHTTRLRRSGGAMGSDGCAIGFTTRSLSTADTWNSSLSSVVLKLIPDPDVTMKFESISADIRINAKGPINVRYAYSIDAGAHWIDAGFDFTPEIADCGGSTLHATWNFPDFSNDTVTYFRFYGYNAIDNQGRLNITNIDVAGSVSLIDIDGDGYGIYIDCNDNDATIHPDAPEICDEIDQDCDGVAEEVTVNIEPSGEIYLCRHETITLTATSGYATYQWYKNGNPIVTETSSTITTEKPGYYQVVVWDGEACYGYSEIQAVAVTDNPFANIYYPEGLDLCFDTNLKLKSSYNADYTYQWYKDGVAIPASDTYKIEATEEGDYFCEITTLFGCPRITDTVTVYKTCRMGDDFSGANDILKVSPNPANNNILLSMQIGDNSNINSTIEIISVNGQNVMNVPTTIVNGLINQTINISSLPNGVYMAKITTTSTQFTTRFVVNK